MPKLTPQEARAEWVKDLRSGKFEQGKGGLCNGGKYCCLGVACSTMRRCEGEEALAEHPSDGIDYTGMLYGSEKTGGIAPDELLSWLGLSTCVGGYNYGNLVTLNDYASKDFDEIATLIESSPEGLFYE